MHEICWISGRNQLVEGNHRKEEAVGWQRQHPNASGTSKLSEHRQNLDHQETVLADLHLVSSPPNKVTTG